MVGGTWSCPWCLSTKREGQHLGHDENRDSSPTSRLFVDGVEEKKGEKETLMESSCANYVS